jgi:hypothetical protein
MLANQEDCNSCLKQSIRLLGASLSGMVQIIPISFEILICNHSSLGVSMHIGSKEVLAPDLPGK